MSHTRIIPLLLAATALSAEVIHDKASQTWTLRSARVEYALALKDGAVTLAYFGPAGSAPWKPASSRSAAPRYDLAGRADGRSLASAAFELTGHEVHSLRTGVDELLLRFRHRLLPLELEARYAAWGDTGVITRRLALANRGTQPILVESLPSLAWSLPPGGYELTYLHGGWGRERQLATEKLGAGQRVFENRRGRSTSGYAPWFCLRNETTGVRYVAQLAWSGNWEMLFERYADATPLHDQDLRAELGLRSDFGGPLALEPGRTFDFPRTSFSASTGDLDDASNNLHRYQRTYVFPRIASNDPPLVQFNSWYPFPGKLSVADLKRCADVAAELGAEVFVLDAGWFNKKDWSRELGDWQVDGAAFPRGLQELSEYVRKKGMKFGIWVEIENLGVESKTFTEHPEWCLSYEGKPIQTSARYHLNFALPEVRQWARAVIDRLVRDYGIEWVKIDYNIDIGEQFDPPSAGRSGDVLYRHLTAYYGWLDDVRGAHPKLIVENCSSGGLRFDAGILEHTHTTWLSDVVRPLPSLQLGYGCTVEFAPQACNHWMVGDKDNGEVDNSRPPGWWDFLFRVPMNGQFGISSRVFDWTPALKQRAAENVALYKHIRSTISAGDAFHLTPQPDHDNPAGWMAIQYSVPDGARSVLLAYRLAKGQPRQTFKLRGLRRDTSYRIKRDGMAQSGRSGAELMDAGLPVDLFAEWRAAVFELDAGRSF